MGQKPPGSVSPESGLVSNVEAWSSHCQMNTGKGTGDAPGRGEQVTPPPEACVSTCSTPGRQVERSMKGGALVPGSPFDSPRSSPKTHMVTPKYLHESGT